MICEVCQQENATVHLTQIISGKMQKIDLCEKCAKEKGVADPAGFSLADMLLGLGAADEIKSSAAQEVACPNCGFTQPDFKKTGRLGCPQCYTTFNDGLSVILKDKILNPFIATGAHGINPSFSFSQYLRVFSHFRSVTL